MLKAIVNTSSNYKNLNHLTFPVAQFLSGNKPLVALEIKCTEGVTTVDFHVDEIVICDFKKEYQESAKHFNIGGSTFLKGKNYLGLAEYARLKGIDFEPELYFPV